MLSGVLNNWEFCFLQRSSTPVVGPFQDLVALKKILAINFSLSLKNTLSKLILPT